MKEPDEYKLIPMSEITDEARRIAVAWMDCEDKHWIGQKHKLTSDIMNYAESYHQEKLKAEQSQEGEICDGCNVRGNWEHRCHGTGCNCDNPVCMERQGRITHDELMKIVSESQEGEQQPEAIVSNMKFTSDGKQNWYSRKDVIDALIEYRKTWGKAKDCKN